MKENMNSGKAALLTLGVLLAIMVSVFGTLCYVNNTETVIEFPKSKEIKKIVKLDSLSINTTEYYRAESIENGTVAIISYSTAYRNPDVPLLRPGDRVYVNMKTMAVDNLDSVAMMYRIIERRYEWWTES